MYHSDEDEDQSPWLQELSIALDAIRASVPNHIQHGHEDPEHDDWIPDAASEDEGSPAYARAQEALAQLVSCFFCMVLCLVPTALCVDESDLAVVGLGLLVTLYRIAFRYL